MIRVHHLSIHLGGRPVVDQLDAAFTPGRVTAILGPNGAGKTSLLRAILGLVPFGGAITLDGDLIAGLSRDLRARRLGYLAQFGAESWNLSVEELVMLGRAPYRHVARAPSPADHAAVEQALSATDTVGFAARRINDLSGGERARVQFARVLATQPDWMLIDEPLNHLDPLHQRNMMRLMRAQAERGVGVIVVLHDLNAAAAVADDVLLLREGKVVVQGRAADVLTRAYLESTYDLVFDVSTTVSGQMQITARAD